MRQPLPMPSTQDKYWAFRGGLDQVSPSISLPPSRCRDASNVEVGTNGGLTVTSGYERYDGRVKPSDATYSMLSITLSGTIAVGATVTGATSAATGYVIAAPSTTSRVLTKVTGTFVVGENLTVAAVVQGVTTSTADAGAAATMALDATYTNLAADVYRADIAAVPGAGSVLGVWQYAGVVYAIRNNVGNTAAVLHKDTAAGWSAVSLGRELAFTVGQAQLVEGATITGAISGATAVIGRIVVTSGSLGASTGAGFIYFASQTGTFQAENINVAGVARGTIAGNSSAVTLTPSGRYEFVNHNFAGSAGTTKMYAASGVHKAFEFNGTTFAFITTGMSADTPSHIFIHKNHLFLSFGHSAQHSAIGNPVSWSVVLGAAELSAGDTITNFVGAPGSTTGGALIIYTRNLIKILYGNSSADWNLVTFNPDAGGLEWTGQYLGQGIVLDDRGVTTMSSSQVFGNFQGADISADVQPYVASLRSTAVASCIVRAKNQYRLFFSGGGALYCTFVANKLVGAMPIALSNPATCVCSLEANSGEEEVFFGSSNGMVYQMERGTSQDGDPIAWNAHLAYNHFGSPRQTKRFRKAVVEVSGTGYAEFRMSSSLGYGTTELPAGDAQTIATALSATVAWDAMTWDQFYWDGQSLTPSEADIDGTAENISLLFSGSSDEFEPITLNGSIVSFTPQRQLR